VDWISRNPTAVTFARFLFLMFHFPLNRFDNRDAQSQNVFLSFEWIYDHVVQSDIWSIQPQHLTSDHLRNLCSYWRYAFRLMIFSPGKVFDALDEVIIQRWFAFIKDPLAKCDNFFRHAYPITIWFLIFQFSLGIKAGVFGHSEDYVIALTILSSLFECLAVCEVTPPDMVPAGLLPIIQGTLPPHLINFYTATSRYLEVCAILIGMLTRANSFVPMLDKAPNIGSRGMSLLRTSISRATGVQIPVTDPGSTRKSTTLILLPFFDYFEAKILAVSKVTEMILSKGKFDESSAKEPKDIESRELKKCLDRGAKNPIRVRWQEVGAEIRSVIEAPGFKVVNDRDKEGLPVNPDRVLEVLNESIQSIENFLPQQFEMPFKRSLKVEIPNVSIPLPTFVSRDSTEDVGLRTEGAISFKDGPPNPG
jgi:hypothetical protein